MSNKQEKKLEKQKEKELLSSMSKEEKSKYLSAKKAEKRIKAEADYEEYNAEYLAKVEEKKKANMNGWNKFLFNVGQTSFCQWFRTTWKKYAIRHPEGSKLLYQVFYFIVFSEGVTIWQYLVLTFLPMIMGIELAGTQFMWPAISMGTYEGTELFYNILGYSINYTNGQVAIGGGLGYFIAFEIATFTAQCINFPLQRNITYRSHGNIWYQAMWYFIGWLGISFVCNAINGAWIPFAQLFLDPAIYNILVMIATGGISMIIFFFVFKVIFPEGEPKKINDDEVLSD